jgi:hypothetical protein
MKYIKIIYNCFLWAMTAATLCFKNEWLQMRVNTGLIFFGLLAALVLIFCVIFRKKEVRFNWLFTVCNLTVCTLVGVFVYGFDRMKVVPAALLREGINQTRIPFGQINIVLLGCTLAGAIVIIAVDLLKNRKK